MIRKHPVTDTNLKALYAMGFSLDPNQPHPVTYSSSHKPSYEDFRSCPIFCTSDILICDYNTKIFIWQGGVGVDFIEALVKRNIRRK